jgi:hypothetical protein
LADLAHAVDPAGLVRRTWIALGHGEGVARLRLLVADDSETRVELEPAAVRGSADTLAFAIARFAKVAELSVIARGSLRRWHHDARTHLARILPRVAHADMARRRRNLGRRAVHTAGPGIAPRVWRGFYRFDGYRPVNVAACGKRQEWKEE